MKLSVGGRPVTSNIKIARGFLTRLIGLTSWKRPEKELAFVLPGCNGIHTFFMKFPLDVIMLNKEGEVVLIKEGMKPNRAVFSFKAETIVEFMAGVVKKNRIRQGDRVRIS